MDFLSDLGQVFFFFSVENPMFCSSSCSMLPLHTELLLITNALLCLLSVSCKNPPQVSPFRTLKGILFYLGGVSLLFWNF